MQIERKRGAVCRKIACLLAVVVAVAACCLLLPPRASVHAQEESSAQTAGEEGLELIAEASQDYFGFSQQFRVFRDESEGRYILFGRVTWEKGLVWFWETPHAAEEVYDDKVCFYLQGETGLRVADSEVSGTYYGGGEVAIGRLETAREEGYLIGWRFREKSGYLGKELEEATFRIELEGTVSPTNKLVFANMRYIHTYSQNDSMLDFALSTGENKGTFTGRNFFSMLGKGSWTASDSVPLAKAA